MLSFYPESLLNKAEIDETEFRRIVVRRLGNHNMPRATIRFDPGIPEWVASDALSDSRRCTRIGAKPHEYKKKTGGLSCPKFGW
jgi:hypothetical protein